MIIGWIAIIFLVVIGLVYMKMEHHGRKAKLIIIVIVGAIIYLSVVGLFSSEKVDLTSPRGVVSAVYIYFGWIGQTASTLWDIGTNTIEVMGNAIKFNNTEEQKR